jgi:Domain of unknown function (DUF4249)
MRLIIMLFFLSITAGISSCNKVIELDLRDSKIQYVIEGLITDEPSGVCKVYLSKSKNFNEDNQFEKVSGAQVKVKDNGTETVLTESQPGLYETSVIKGTPAHLYQLSVIIDNQTFTASCTMPQPVGMDTLYIAPGPFGQYKFATIGYTDPGNINNGYRFVQYVNGVKEPTIFWENDEFTDGQSIIMQLDASADEKDDPRNIKTGDNVTIEMLTLDEPIYEYWYTLRSGGGDGNANTAAPANPLTNIQGGALGYFSAHTVRRKSVVAP